MSENTELPKLGTDLHKAAKIHVVKSDGKYKTLKGFVEIAVREKLIREKGMVE